MLVKAVMNKPVTAKDEISVRQAAKIMSNRGIGSLIIVKDKKIVGIITERDIMRNVAKLEGKVTGVMSKSVKTIGPDEDVNAAADTMSRYKIKRLPVVSDKKLVGIITATDVLAHSGGFGGEEFFFG
jgi:CBS domain-containing protein